MALGKGIASLIQETPNEILAKKLKNDISTTPAKKEVVKEQPKEESAPYLISVDQIKTNPNQPRKIFKDKELEELSQSIIENGIIQPLIVGQANNGVFDLIAGERRLRAAKKAGLTKVPVVIKRGTDKDKMVMSIIENIQRSDLNCIEEALAYYQLMDEFHLTQEEVAKKLGKERSSIANFLRILKLPRQVVDQVQKDLLTFGHAKILAGVKERERAIRLANEAIDKQLSVRELEKLIKSNRKVKEEKAPSFDQDERLNVFREKLEKQTGFHFKIAQKSAGAGQIIIKYGNEAEFNDVYEYLLDR